MKNNNSHSSEKKNQNLYSTSIQYIYIITSICKYETYTTYIVRVF